MGNLILNKARSLRGFSLVFALSMTALFQNCGEVSLIPQAHILEASETEVPPEVPPENPPTVDLSKQDTQTYVSKQTSPPCMFSAADTTEWIADSPLQGRFEGIDYFVRVIGGYRPYGFQADGTLLPSSAQTFDPLISDGHYDFRHCSMQGFLSFRIRTPKEFSTWRFQYIYSFFSPLGGYRTSISKYPGVIEENSPCTTSNEMLDQTLDFVVGASESAEPRWLSNCRLLPDSVYYINVLRPYEADMNRMSMTLVGRSYK